MKIGGVVTVKERREGYYSNYAGNPEFYFEPGMIGIVGAVKCPRVHTNGYFDCIDFFCPITGRIQRCSSNRNNIRKLKVKADELLAKMAEQTPWLIERMNQAG